MAIQYGVISNIYVVDDYVASGYVAGKTIDITSTVSATGRNLILPGNIVYSWDDTSTSTYSWDNWWLTDQTWEQKGLIVRIKGSVDTLGGYQRRGTSVVSGTCTVTGTAVRYRGGTVTVSLGSVVVLIGAVTPVGDPFRTATVDSETRLFPVTSETRSTTIQSETRIIIVPDETRTITLKSETRKFLIPIPPFVSENIRR